MSPVAHVLAEPVVAAPTATFDEVYRAHARFVWRTLRTFGVAEAQLEDALQDTFVVVHRRLGEFGGRARVQTWLFAIARRVASQYRRASGRAERRQGEEDATALAASDDTFAALSRAEAAAAVAAILERMDEDRRVVFALVELEQVAVPEVARLLGLNLNTTYSRLRLARRDFEAAIARRSEDA
jgi:RNA polymerase sigma-70 factor (ECF subfamily)